MSVDPDSSMANRADLEYGGIGHCLSASRVECRLSRVAEMILAAELEPARALAGLVEHVLEPGMTRYQFLDALLELSSALER